MSWGFDSEKMSEEKIAKLKELARLARGDILKMTTLAKSGHPGGSMSSIDVYLVLYSCANVNPADPYWAERDRIVISHGHTSPGVYAALARVGFFEVDSAITKFRKAGTIFEGHVERKIPGVEWSSGNLGQGLSAGCGFALASKLLRRNYQVFVVMSDGEQAKGQVGEARRFAKKYSLNNLTVVIDYNELQLSGPLNEIMPQNIKENYLADGWEILEVDGHNYQQIYQAIRTSVKNSQSPVAIMAKTTMGKSVSFMENRFEFHGMPLTSDECAAALSELGLENDMEKYLDLRNKIPEKKLEKKRPPEKIKIDIGQPRSYTKDEITDNRSAFGQALRDLGELNSNQPDRSPIAVLDCDLVGSVKTQKFAQTYPDHFFQAGIQEHNTATVAGALSTQGVVTFFADFGVFGVDETYNQHRLNDLNQTNLKLVCTHNGIDVGQDGKTHQCIDYVGIINNLYGYKIIIPADPNQTDRVIRYIASQPGNFFVGVGRSKFPVILREDGRPFFAGDYQFRYGKAEVIREGNQAAIITTGSMVHRAVQAWETLRKRGCRVRIVNVSCLSDLDENTLTEAVGTGIVVTYEDHNVNTGLGSLVANFLAENSLAPRFRKLGITTYGGSGLPEDLFRIQGLDIESLVETVLGGR
ncbi:MAG: transketolase [bacterium]